MEIHKRVNTEKGYDYEVTKIHTVDDFIIYFNGIKNSDDFLSLPEDAYNYVKDNINNKVSYKSFLKTVSKLINSPRFKNKIEYWTCRGYSIEEAELKVKELQTFAANSFAKKRKENPKKYSGIIPNQIEYWTKKGYSIENAKLMVAERQSTFSKEKCIQMYGRKEGLNKFYERNKKWQESRIKSEGKKWHYSSQALSIEKYKERYGNNWLKIWNDHLISRYGYTELVESNITLINLNLDKKSILEYLMKCDFDKLFMYSSNLVVQHLLDMNHLEIKSKWMEFNNIKSVKSKYGNLYWNAGKFYKSDGEFNIGEYLDSLNLSFSVNTKYEGTNRYSDFYINDLDLYIEYMGMNIDSYSDKIKQMSDLPYNIIWSNNINQIKNIIYEKIHK